MPGEGLTLRLEGDELNFCGRVLDRGHFIRPFNVPDSCNQGDLHDVVSVVRWALAQEGRGMWVVQGLCGFKEEYGEDTFNELERLIKLKPDLKIVFLGSACGTVITSVFDLPGAEKVEIHEYALTDDYLRSNPQLLPFLESGRLVFHGGPLEFIPLEVENVDLIFSRFGPFYHTEPRYVYHLIEKAVAALSVGGKAKIMCKGSCDAVGLRQFFGDSFVVDVDNILMNERLRYVNSWVLIERVA